MIFGRLRDKNVVQDSGGGLHGFPGGRQVPAGRGRGRRGGRGEDAAREGRERQQRRVVPFYSMEQRWSKYREIFRKRSKISLH